MFSRMEISTRELQRPEVLAAVKAKGFSWIRRRNPPFDSITRDPTVGCFVELFSLQHPGCVALDSPAAKKLINRVCYF
jgi:hypothetical protein